jgi:serine/threonine protein kinase
MCSKTEWHLKDFDVGHHLGTGKFGSVFLAQEKLSSELVALKILKKEELELATVVPFLKREIEIQAHLK